MSRQLKTEPEAGEMPQEYGQGSTYARREERRARSVPAVECRIHIAYVSTLPASAQPEAPANEMHGHHSFGIEALMMQSASESFVTHGRRASGNNPTQDP